MNRRAFIIKCLLGFGLVGAAGKWLGLDAVLSRYVLRNAKSNEALGGEPYYRIVVMGDPHLPVREREVKGPAEQQNIIQAKNKVVDDINAWEDVAEIAVLGDIAAQFGVESEYMYAKQFFSRLTKPVYFISGNHDYIYQDAFSPGGKFVLADEASRARKLKQFKETFDLPSLFHSHQAGRYQLIYLSPDSLESRRLAEIGETQLAWLRGELQHHPHSPTLVFFHAPLKDTLHNYNNTANTPDFVAQPETALAAIIRENPQIGLWVSGHTHTPATNESYAADEINTYGGHVRNIHTPDMDRETIWTNSLYLYPDKVVIRTFNHQSKQWEEKLDRTISLRMT